MERVTDVPSNFGLKVCRCPEETRGKKLLVYVYGPIYIMEQEQKEKKEYVKIKYNGTK